MRFLIIGILMGFPLLEASVLYQLASGPSGHAGWVLAWLIFATAAGVILIKEARFSLVTRLASALSQGQFSLAAIIDSFRTVVAGLLLIFPGVISDIMAICLLLLPIKDPALQFATARNFQPRSAAPRRNESVIEGEFRRDN